MLAGPTETKTGRWTRQLLLFEEAAFGTENSIRTGPHISSDFHVNSPFALIGRSTAGPEETWRLRLFVEAAPRTDDPVGAGPHVSLNFHRSFPFELICDRDRLGLLVEAAHGSAGAVRTGLHIGLNFHVNSPGSGSIARALAARDRLSWNCSGGETIGRKLTTAPARVKQSFGLRSRFQIYVFDPKKRMDQLGQV